MSDIYAEEIIKRIRKEKEPVQNEDWFHIENDINQGYVVVKYEKLELEEKSILNSRLTMLLPKSFGEMEYEMKLAKYPDPDRPEWIYSNEEGDVTITFHLEEGEVKPEEVEEIRDIMADQMKRLYPSSVIEEKEIIGEGEELISRFSLDIPLIDDTCYHAMFFRAMNQGLLMGTFDCGIQEKKQWKKILVQLLGTMREKEIDINGENNGEYN